MYERMTMERKERIDRLIQAPGATGLEGSVAGEVLGQLSAMGAEAWQDTAGNVFGRIGTQGPVVLLMAHMDEVAMMVHRIEDNGMVRLWKIAGVDPRILPGSSIRPRAPCPAWPGPCPPICNRGRSSPPIPGRIFCAIPGFPRRLPRPGSRWGIR